MLVDVSDAGVWFSADVNPELRWADLDFEIPPSLTSGKSELQIELYAGESPTPWTAFEHSALSYAP